MTRAARITTVVLIGVLGLFVMDTFPTDVQRSILMAQFIGCAALASFLAGTAWLKHGTGITVTTIGSAGIFIYLVAGQAKALNLGIPFDVFSWIGVVASGLFLIGAAWTLRTDHRWR